MDPIITALLSTFLDSAIKGINEYVQTQQARADITDLEKQSEIIAGQARVIAAYKWAMDALANPDIHGFLRDIGGQLKPIVPAGAPSATVQPGVPS